VILNHTSRSDSPTDTGAAHEGRTDDEGEGPS
jgi:hypothetical protein